MKRVTPYYRSHTPGKMNKLEADYAAYLDMLQGAGHFIRWRYEPVRLRLAGKATTYTPDFLVTFDDHMELHEVKGRWLSSARVKWKVAADAYPEFLFIAVTRVSGQWLKEEYKP